MYSIVVQSETTLLNKIVTKQLNSEGLDISIHWENPTYSGDAAHGTLIYFSEFLQQIYFPILKFGEVSERAVVQQVAIVVGRILQLIERYDRIFVVDFTIDIDWTTLGLAQATGERGLYRYLRLANEALREQFRPNGQVRVIDAGYYWGGGRSPIALELYLRTSSCFTTMLAETFSRRLKKFILSLDENPVKCVCFDLDDTVWGGVAGDTEYVQQLVIGGISAEGRAFENVQILLKELKAAGLFLAVISKNSPEVVRRVFDTHPGMILSESDISVFELGFEKKSQRLERVAARLNIGLDALFFVDDNPVERQLVKQELPEVEVFEYPANPVFVPALLQGHPRLQKRVITAEDVARTKFSASGIGGESSPDQFKVDKVDFESEINVRVAGGADFDRIFQLINKTNQFTTRSWRCAEGELLMIMRQDGVLLLVAEVSDQFSKHGVMGLLVGKTGPSESWITDVIVSCRVFGRGVEWALLEKFRSLMPSCSKLSLILKSSGRNGVALQFASEVPLRSPDIIVIYGDDCVGQ